MEFKVEAAILLYVFKPVERISAIFDSFFFLDDLLVTSDVFFIFFCNQIRVNGVMMYQQHQSGSSCFGSLRRRLSGCSRVEGDEY